MLFVLIYLLIGCLIALVETANETLKIEYTNLISHILLLLLAVVISPIALIVGVFKSL